MNWMEFAVAMSGTLAWPIAILVVILVFKYTKGD